MNHTNNHGKIRLWGEHASAVFSITLVLFVFGLLMFIEYHSYRTTHDMQERITFRVDLTPDITDSTAISLQEEISEYGYVKNVEYISKDEAAALFTEELNDDFIGFLGYNPLYPTLMVNFKTGIVPEHEKKVIDQFTSAVGQLPFVTGVVYQENVVNELNDVFYKISWFLIIFIVLLLFICVMLISNTIKITIYATQQTIQTLRLVGATNNFIARPFLWRSVLFGFLGGLFADILLAVAIYSFSSQFSLHILTKQFASVYGLMAAAIPVVGIIISYFATLGSIHRYLRIKQE